MTLVHPDTQTFLRYVSGSVSEDTQMAVDAHLAECGVCLSRMRALHYLRSNFDSLWDSWTAEEHGRICHRWQMAVALKHLSESSPSLTGRLGTWLARQEQRIGTAITILVDTTKKLATVAASELPDGQVFAPRPALGVGDVSSERDRLAKASSLLGDGHAEDALEELSAVAETDVRLPSAVGWEVRVEGERKAEVTVLSRRGRVFVKVWPHAGTAGPELAVLLPKGMPEAVSAAEFESVESAEYLLAEFKDVESGQFEVIW